MQGTKYADTDTAYQFYHWRHINYDLSALAGRTVRIRLHYWGKNGDSMLLDDFEIIQKGGDVSETNINQGESVHYINYSTGTGLAYSWSFPGGQPETSQAENPIVTYRHEGVYDVSLTVTDANGLTSTATRPSYVNVHVAEPVADVNLPASGYYRVGGGISIPNNKWVTFSDASTNFPTQWDWTLNGANETQLSGEKATVYYPNQGYFSFNMTVANKAGSDTYESDSRAVKVGGAASYVWNLDENQGKDIKQVS
ncbi:MAG: PKD domain-containing protein, partial [Muribaculaceae bacterium]|nr:PKD domain-containing protein [Muribaculaceae bacterium]